MIKKSVLLMGLICLLVVPTGCIFSPDDGGDDIIIVKPKLQFPDTPDKLMENFSAIYTNMDIEGYRNLLSPDYKTILKASTTTEFPEVGTELDYSEEIQIQTNMFSGASGHDSAGNPTNPISSISFQEPIQVTSWEATPLSDPHFPGASNALYNVLFEFNRAGDKTLQVTGQIRFYITSRDSLYNGAVRPYYQMVGQEDLTND